MVIPLHPHYCENLPFYFLQQLTLRLTAIFGQLTGWLVWHIYHKKLMKPPASSFLRLFFFISNEKNKWMKTELLWDLQEEKIVRCRSGKSYFSQTLLCHEGKWEHSLNQQPLSCPSFEYTVSVNHDLMLFHQGVETKSQKPCYDQLVCPEEKTWKWYNDL